MADDPTPAPANPFQAMIDAAIAKHAPAPAPAAASAAIDYAVLARALAAELRPGAAPTAAPAAPPAAPPTNPLAALVAAAGAAQQPRYRSPGAPMGSPDAGLDSDPTSWTRDQTKAYEADGTLMARVEAWKAKQPGGGGRSLFPNRATKR